MGVDFFHRCVGRRHLSIRRNRSCGRGYCEDSVLHLSGPVPGDSGSRIGTPSLKAAESIRASLAGKEDR